MSRAAEYKGQASDFSIAHVDCAIGVLLEKAPKGTWRTSVAVDGALAAQKRIVVSPMSAAEVAAEAAAVQAACAAARAAATYAVRISGATSNYAYFVNGVYEVTDEVFGGMPVYKKQGGDMWLEYHFSTSNWMSRATAHKGQAKAFFYALVGCANGLLPDKAPIGTWLIAVNGSLVAQASIAVTPMSAAEVAAEAAAVQAACAAARAAATYAVRISGATSNYAYFVNGVYEVTDEVSGGMPVYKRRGGLADQVWLEYHVSLCQWMTRMTASKGQVNRNCTAYVGCAHGVLPDKAPTGEWHVLNGFTFTAQANVKVCPELSRSHLFRYFLASVFFLLTCVCIAVSVSAGINVVWGVKSTSLCSIILLGLVLVCTVCYIFNPLSGKRAHVGVN